MEDKVKFIYVMDPLCGWCFGFSQVSVKLYEMYHHLLDFQLVVGGLMEGSRVGPLQEVAPFIPNALHIVEEGCQVTFGQLYLENIIEANDTLNSRAMNKLIKTAGWLKPHRVFHAAAAIQKAHYEMGIPSENSEELAYAIETSGFNAEDLIGGSGSEKANQLVLHDYDFVRSNSLGGFPCCLLETSSGYQVLSQGYTSFAEMKAKIEQCLPEITQYY